MLNLQNKKPYNYISRDHFGVYLGSGVKHTFFRYQNIIFKIEAIILKICGVNINKISTFDKFLLSRKYFVLSDIILCFYSDYYFDKNQELN